MKKSPFTTARPSISEHLSFLRARLHDKRFTAGLLFASLFAVVAIIAISFANAATTTVSIEAESGQLNGATAQNAAGASGGQHVAFQAGGNPNPNPNPGGSNVTIPKSGALLGMFSDPNPQISSTIGVLETNIGRKFDMRMKFYAFNSPDGGILAQLNAGAIDDDLANGRIPVVSWQAANWGGDFGNNHMGAIANGQYDAYLAQVADKLKSYNKPIQLRFAHEMNGNWYGWSKASTEEYKAGWRHAYNLFKNRGATNVQWNWCPFWMDFGKKFTDYYPGDEYVDVVGIDVYVEEAGKNLGDVLNDGPGSVYGTYKDRKPIMIMETMSGPRGNLSYQDKTTYFNNMVNVLKNKFPKISGVVFFDENKSAAFNAEGAEMSIAKTNNGAANAANMAAFVNMTKDCYWGTDARQAACKGQ